MSSTLYNVVDLTNSVFWKNLVKIMDLQHTKNPEAWNLDRTSPPLKTIMKATLSHLNLKTVFLLNLALGRRRFKIHMPSCIIVLGLMEDWSASSTNKVLCPRTKSLKTFYTFPTVGDYRDQPLCPVRFLKACLDLTKEHLLQSNGDS